jgi:hypothetical protein
MNIWLALYLIMIVYLVEYLLGWLELPNNLGSLKGFVNYLLIGFGKAPVFYCPDLFFPAVTQPLSDLALANLS